MDNQLLYHLLCNVFIYAFKLNEKREIIGGVAGGKNIATAQLCKMQI